MLFFVEYEGSFLTLQTIERLTATLAVAIATTLTTTIATTLTTTLVATTVLASEIPQLVNHVKHSIRVDGIVPRVTAGVFVYLTREVALLMQDVVELERDNEFSLWQQFLRNLSVPYKLIRVKRCIGIASA